MDEKILHKLSDLTELMYGSIMSQLKSGYYALWCPRIQKLNMAMEELVAGYESCVRGELLEEQYQTLSRKQKECLELEHLIFEQGELDQMNMVKQEFSETLSRMKQVLEQGVKGYDMLEDEFLEVYACEKEFVTTSNHLVEDYKIKLRNRMKQNMDKVSQFEQLTAEERKYFMTHVILFDEGKLENMIFHHLAEAEEKVKDTFKDVEQKAIICGKDISFEESRQYVHQYRVNAKKADPKEFSTSRRLQEAESVENKFEAWFENLLGSESTVGKLINQQKKADDFPMEERMIKAVEDVVNGNLGGLDMTKMIEAYREECAALKEDSFKRFFGDYEQVKKLVGILENAVTLVSQWEANDVSIADIILGTSTEYTSVG